MLKTKAQNVLGLKDGFDPDQLKNIYHRLALKYHPDKNHSEEAKERFQEIREAYETLQGSSHEIPSYMELLRTFLQNFVDEKIVKMVMEKLARICENRGLELIKRLHPAVLKKIVDLLNHYGDMFSFSEEFMDQMNEVNNDERTIVHPTLEDLFEDKVLRLVMDERVYWVPLWHHQLVFDGPKEIQVECFPILPEGMQIDEYNHLHIYVKKGRNEIWDSPVLEYEIAGRKFLIPREELVIKENQVYVFRKSGIPLIQFGEKIYDVSLRGDIIFNIELV